MFVCLLPIALSVVLPGCNAGNRHETSKNPSKSSLQWKLGNVSVHWKDAYEYCENLASREGIAWRLPSVLEVHRQFADDPNDLLMLRTDNDVWSALFNESGVHFTVNLDNGAKRWRGDDVALANALCVSGETWDGEAWIEEVYNARLTGRTSHMVEVITTEAKKGNPAGQLELGNLYLDGQGVAQDDKLAAHWFKLAADQGQNLAEKNLAEMHRVGRGLQ